MKKENHIVNYLKSIKRITSGVQLEYYNWLLENGKYYDEAQTIPNSFGMANARECYKTSLIEAVTQNGLKYVEGFYVTELGIPLEHAFNADNDDKAVDYTAIQNNVVVLERFGVELPSKYILEFIESDYNGVLSYLSWWYQFKKESI